MYSDNMNKLISAIRTYEEREWSNLIYDNFSSNRCDNYDEIYEDFKGKLNKVEFCSKWEPHYCSDSDYNPIEKWYDDCMEYYVRYLNAISDIHIFDRELNEEKTD
jgi:hypothetical protein